MCNPYKGLNPKFILEEAGLLTEELDHDRPWAIKPDAWPKADWPVVFQGEKRTLTTMRWGVWPYYERTMPARPIVNARDDALLKKDVWKKSIAVRRCVIPADGFFEWAGPEGAMWEVLFHLSDERPFFFAGLWSYDPVGEGRGFALVTGKPNELVAALPHKRMPVIMERDAAKAWIGSSPLPEQELLAMCAPFPSEKMVRKDMSPPPKRIAVVPPKRTVIPAEPGPRQGELF